MVRRPSKVPVRNYALAALLSLALVWLVFLNINIFRKEEIARHTARDTQAQLASLQSRQKTLEANMKELDTERGQEATLRETFGVAKPGEGVIIVVPAKEATSTPQPSFWDKWFDWAEFWKKKAPAAGA